MTLDRRVRRSRRQLHDALLALIIEQEYESITIQAVADRADLNRATFYLHYKNKEELLVAALEERFDEIVAILDGLPRHAPVWVDNTPARLVFEHVADHAALYKVLLSRRGTGYIAYRILNYIADYTENRLSRELPAQADPQLPLALVARHIAGSLFALLSWWITHDMPHPPEYMAGLTFQLCLSGTGGVMALPDWTPAEMDGG